MDVGDTFTAPEYHRFDKVKPNPSDLNNSIGKHEEKGFTLRKTILLENDQKILLLFAKIRTIGDV